jgi:hypothetical protein
MRNKGERNTTSCHGSVCYSEVKTKVFDHLYVVDFRHPQGEELVTKRKELYFANARCKNPASEVVMSKFPGARIQSVVLG